MAKPRRTKTSKKHNVPAREPTSLDHFKRMARDARSAAEQFASAEEALNKLRKAAQEVGKAWSKGWFGYHARTYKADLAPMRPGDYWDVDFAWDPTSSTNGEWREFTHDSLIEIIRNRADNPDMKEIDRVVAGIGKVFDRVRSEAIATLAAIANGDEFLNTSRRNIEAIPRRYTAQQFVRSVIPQQLRIPLDSRAAHDQPEVPPHLHIEGICFERTSYAEASRKLATELENLVAYLTAKARSNVPNVSQGDASRVFVIHGRNIALLNELRAWLDALGLHAKGFADLRVELGGSPTIMEVIQKGISEARAVIALMTPDEVAFLRPELRQAGDGTNDIERWQARPNVLFEAGMAFAMAGSKRTLLLVAGAELFSDVSGIHYLTIPHDASSRDRLRKALQSMGCTVRDDSQHHQRGNFAVSGLDRLKTRSPF